MTPADVITVCLVIAGFVAAFLSWIWAFVIIAAACIYQYILDYGRTSPKIRTMFTAIMMDSTRFLVFVVPLIIALIKTEWLIAIAVFLAFFLNFYYTKYPEPKE